jgi:hypothetical protein
MEIKENSELKLRKVDNMDIGFDLVLGLVMTGISIAFFLKNDGIFSIIFGTFLGVVALMYIISASVLSAIKMLQGSKDIDIKETKNESN